MKTEFRNVGVIVRRSPADHKWLDEIWTPEAVLPQAPATPAWTPLGKDGDAELIYAGEAQLELFSSDTAFYRENLLSGDAKLWVALKRDLSTGALEIMKVTADPNEGEICFESGAEIVGTVPVPDDLAQWIADFANEHHVERPFIKRQRDKSGPDPRKNPGVDRSARMRGQN